MTYPGGKSAYGVYQRIINQMPPHKVYIEPFLGGGGILLRKWLAALTFGIDRHRLALEIARSRIAENGNADIGFIEANERAPIADIARIGDGIGNIARNGDRESPRIVLIQGDGIEFIEGYPFKGDEVLYCDPPYPMSVRRWQQRRYEFEMSDADHARLLTALNAVPCRILVSGYRCKLYDDHLPDWRAVTYNAPRRGRQCQKDE